MKQDLLLAAYPGMLDTETFSYGRCHLFLKQRSREYLHKTKNEVAFRLSIYIHVLLGVHAVT